MFIIDRLFYVSIGLQQLTDGPSNSAVITALT